MIETILKKGNALIVDVRTPEEFANGHVPKSITIPIDNLHKKREELLELKKPLVLCCASSGRSALTLAILKQRGFNEVYDAGSWLNVNYYQNK